MPMHHHQFIIMRSLQRRGPVRHTMQTNISIHPIPPTVQKTKTNSCFWSVFPKLSVPVVGGLRPIYRLALPVLRRTQLVPFDLKHYVSPCTLVLCADVKLGYFNFTIPALPSGHLCSTIGRPAAVYEIGFAHGPHLPVCAD